MSINSLLREIKRAKSEGHLYRSVDQYLKQFMQIPGQMVYYYSSSAKNPMWNLEDLERGIASHISESPVSKEQVERIIDCYRKMKEDQKNVNEVYLPSKHWQNNVDGPFSHLTAAIFNKDEKAIKGYLSNFLRIHLGIETESTMKLTSYVEKVRYLNMLIKLYDAWNFISPNPDIQNLARPLIGNPRGYYLNGHFITIGSFFNEYSTLELRQLLSGIDHSVICEIGGGFGKMAYYFLKEMKNCTYLDFDLPEMIVIIFYYLSSIFPGKKVLLYGEHQFDSSSLDSFDLILLPNFDIDKLPNNSCDLFINKNSFGEMNKSAVEMYISYIERCCRKFFFHMNHERFPDTCSSDPGLAAKDYPVQEKYFKRIYRMLDIGHFVAYGESSDIFSYLYEKRA